MGELFADRRLERAERRLRDRIRADPHSIEARLELADALIRLGRPTQAVRQFLTVADIHVSHDHYAHAVRTVKQALDLDPENMDATERFGRLERVKGTLQRRDRILELLADWVRARPGQTHGLTPRELQDVWPGVGSSALIGALSDHQLVRLFAAMDVKEHEIGSVLVRQGQHLGQCFMVVGGVVEAVVVAGGESRVLLLFGPGDLIGETMVAGAAHVPAAYRTATARTRVLGLSKRRLGEVATDAAELRTLLGALLRHGRDRELVALLSH